MSTIIDTNPLLPLGTQAPDFDLPATGGRQVKLSDYLGKNLIIVFYPKDQTPGCTQQLCALRDDTALFQGLNTEFLGSNPDSMESHEKFASAQSYQFPILVDANRTMAKAYRALKEDGKGIQRTVYIIDAKGVIRFAKQGLPPDSELVEIIKTFS